MLAEIIFSIALIGKPIQISVEKQNQPVSGVEVNLLGFQNGQPVENLKEKTSKQGIAAFDIQQTENITFIFRTVFKGIQYLSPLLDGNNLPKKIPSIKVFDISNKRDGVLIRERSLFFGWSNNSLEVQDEIIVENKSASAFLGESDSLTISLPANVHDLKFDQGFVENEVKIDKNDIIINSPVIPGSTRYLMIYNIETKSTDLLFTSKTSLPVQKISIGSDITKFNPQSLDWIAGPSKLYDEKKISIWSLGGKNLEDLSFKISGLPRVWHFNFIMPFFILSLLIGLMLFFKNRNSKTETFESKELLLQQLLDLETLLEKKIIASNEYKIRRLDLLSKLSPFYERKSV